MTGSGNAGVSAQRPIKLGEEKCNELAKQLGFVKESDSSFPNPPTNVPYVKGPYRSLSFDGNLDDIDRVKITIKKPGKMGQAYFSVSRGRRATPYRVFITEHRDMKNINEEVDMSFVEALAQSGDDDACRYWIKHILGTHARQFFRMVFSELWTWESGESCHLNMLNILDERQ